MNRRAINRYDPAVIAAQVEISYYHSWPIQLSWYEYHGYNIDVYFWR